MAYNFSGCVRSKARGVLMAHVHKAETWGLRRPAVTIIIFIMLLASALSRHAQSVSHLTRLHRDLLWASRELNRPVCNRSDILHVELQTWLTQIRKLDVVEQMLTLDLWLEEAWNDCTVRWRPEDYGGIRSIHTLPSQLWLPDLVIAQAVEGDMSPRIEAAPKVKVGYDGHVTWEFPLTTTVMCPIDVRRFPFDEQMCRFGIISWSHDGDKVRIMPPNLPPGGDETNLTLVLEDYYPNMEWDLTATRARKDILYYPCCAERYENAVYIVALRRRPLFYVVTVISPCLVISFATVFTFLLPVESGEKISMLLLIFGGLCIFLLLVSAITPPSVFGVPLLSVYILFILFLIFVAIMATVGVIHISKRSPATHVMSPWIRRLFLHRLATLLRMGEPPKRRAESTILDAQLNESSAPRCEMDESALPGAEMEDLNEAFPVAQDKMGDNIGQEIGHWGSADAHCAADVIPEVSGMPERWRGAQVRYRGVDPTENAQVLSTESAQGGSHVVPPRCLPPCVTPDSRLGGLLLREGVLGVGAIAECLGTRWASQGACDDWTKVAAVLDRLLLGVFAVLWLSGTLILAGLTLPRS